MSEKSEFSSRLRAALASAGYEQSAAVIEHEFNVRWWGGKPISQQAAWNWLNGKSIPTQDKLQTLAEWLKIEPQVLRFGEQVAVSVREYSKRWDEQMGLPEREVLDTYLRLPSQQRLLLRDVILTYAKVYLTDEAPFSPPSAPRRRSGGR
ncbi:XRE family transcriptional regulator [Aquabacterium sp. OR-4]|uniref:XRE family transcriptional regulator n=1 Tax=Aquabacterium sp. OR-4 TaxID=2978127 RepID=UPI0021B379BB|nr:XRE family transcriptional regulator [Aquabacterium sp. OR-4]MDT7834598.1 XRE family transcriptional regulator [Aquabacterium sp. OR-4]